MILKSSIQAKLTIEDIKRFTDLGIFEINDSDELVLVASNFEDKGKNCVTSEIYNEIITYLNEKAQAKYKPNVQATRRLINGRLGEGYTLEDFKKVIDFCCSEWLKDPIMRPYLRPSTIFRASKFEGYLYQAEAIKPKPQKKEQQNEVKENYGVLLDW